MIKPFSRAKRVLKNRFPALVPVIRRLRAVGNSVYWARRKHWPLAKVFQDARDSMIGMETVSGGGSTLASTRRIRQELPLLIAKYGVKSLLDAPCGDFNWMKEVALELDTYTGVDIVPDIIQSNVSRFQTSTRRFQVLDLTHDPLPRADLILCRDCLVHLSFDNIRAALRNFVRSNAKYLITTQFLNLTENRDIVSGDWRPINLCLPPFNLPDPMETILEDYEGENGMYRDKALVLWSNKALRSL